MGWFDEQIRLRKQRDNDAFQDAFSNIAGAVMGRRIAAALNDQRTVTKDAIDVILKYYHVKSREVPDNITEMNEQLEFLLRPYGIMRRTVKLSGEWYRDAIGAMLGIRRDTGVVVALVPAGLTGYCYFDADTGGSVNINAKNAGLFDSEALAFYKPFPLKAVGLGELIRYVAQTLSGADLLLIAGATLAVSLVGMFLPRINNILFSDVVEQGSMSMLAAVAVLLLCVSVSSVLLTGVKNLIMARIQTKMNITVQAAAMMRILSLPASFFQNYSSGDLSQRAGQITQLCNTLVSTVLSTGLTSVFSLVYLPQIGHYAPALLVPSLVILTVTAGFAVVSALMQMRITRQIMDLEGQESGMTYALLSGIQKIKLSGAEKRVFARWGNLYAKYLRLEYNPPVLIRVSSVISLGISLAGTLVLYHGAVRSGISVADYYAFHAAYGMVSGAFLSLAGIAQSVAQIAPLMQRVKPILDAVPEVSEGKQMVTRLSGGIELNNVTFRYRENQSPILDNLSLKIRPGQYVAIVGKTGCGKSTLMRLLLGFETPQKGAVYYDGRDLNSLDLKSLRRRIGVVIQNGKLFQGDIFSNITVCAPWLSMEEAWQAAERAGIAEDIRRMPMGMHTLISEGSGGISGGQRQRLLIARAIAPKPKILMFDEATSALDNMTQKTVSESLDSLKCTRIVIAHRLSTIRHCDRIIVLDGGKIIEDGSYEDLIAQGGFFAELVERQRLDQPERRPG